jgi:mono/diheme cytochrome c family protein
MHLSNRVFTLLTALSVVFIAGCHAPSAGSSIPSYDGARLYREHCASCHGKTGAGDGPLTAQLKAAPADLRRLSSRNNGRFPRRTVMNQIDGRDILLAHGSREMPVWGWRFGQADNDYRDPTKQVEARIEALLDHLVSIQVNRSQ